MGLHFQGPLVRLFFALYGSVDFLVQRCGSNLIIDVISEGFN